MENTPKQKQSFSKDELKRAGEALDKIFPSDGKISDEEKREYEQLIKWNQMLLCVYASFKHWSIK